MGYDSEVYQYTELIHGKYNRGELSDKEARKYMQKLNEWWREYVRKGGV